MKGTLAFLVALSLSVLVVSSSPCEEGKTGWERFKLTYAVDKSGFEKLVSHRLIEPEVKNFIRLPTVRNAAGFAAGFSAGQMRVDTDGDGAFDVKSRKPSFLAKFELTFPDGASADYAAFVYRYNTRLGEKTETPLYRWRRACCMRGRVKGERIEVFDDNADGLYDGLFEDSIRVGRNACAAPYTGLIVLKGTLYECRLDPHGRFIEVRPYSGPTGTVDVFSGFEPPAKHPVPLACVLETRKNGKRFGLDVAACKECPVPVGEYSLKFAALSKRIFVRAGKHAPIVVKAGGKTVVKWGGPWSLDARVWCEMGGYEIEVDSSGPYPKWTQAPSNDPYVKITFPVLRGAEGEEYYGNPLYADLEGNCFPEDVDSFTVLILDPRKKQINKGKHIWKSRDNTGYGYSEGRTFEKYQCPFPDYRGDAVVILRCSTRAFGELELRKNVEIVYQE